MTKKSKKGNKVCLLLERLGIPSEASPEKLRSIHIVVTLRGKSVCQLCSLPKCVIDKPGLTSGEENSELERIWKVLTERRG